MARNHRTTAGTVGKADLMNMAQKNASLKLTKEVLVSAYDAICQSIYQAVTNGNTVVLQGLGRFQPIIREGGIAHNPQTREEVEFPARLNVKFAVNNNFKTALHQVDIKSLGTGEGAGEVGADIDKKAEGRKKEEQPKSSTSSRQAGKRVSSRK